MNDSDKVWVGISGGAMLFGAGAVFWGVPMGIPCLVIGGLILLTTLTNLRKPE